jgi:hypothetical protein
MLGWANKWNINGQSAWQIGRKREMHKKFSPKHESIKKSVDGRTTLSINLLAPEFYVYILAHPVCKMWIIQKQ